MEVPLVPGVVAPMSPAPWNAGVSRMRGARVGVADWRVMSPVASGAVCRAPGGVEAGQH